MKSTILKKWITVIVILTSIINGLLAYGNIYEKVDQSSFLINSKDSLLIAHTNVKKVVVILPGSEVKIWIANKKEEGIVKEIENDELILLSDNVELPIKINEISKIRLMGTERAQKNGTLIIMMGVGALAVASGLAVLFLANGIDGWVVVIGSMFAGPPALVGYFALRFGLRKRGRSYTIEDNGWNFRK